MKKYFVTAAAIAAFATSATVASAQAVSFDAARVQQVCASSGAQCSALVKQIVAQLKASGLPAANVNTQLGVLASSVASAAQSPAANVEVVDLSASLQEIAAASTDEAQAEGIAELAGDIQSGDVSAEDIADATGASGQ